MMQYLGALLLSLGLLTLGGCTSPFSSMDDTNPVSSDDVVIETGLVESGELVMNPDKNEAGILDLSTIQINSNGTEPFWNFMASGNNLVFQEPSMSGPISSILYAITMTQTPTTIMINGSGFDALLTLQTCSDGMSDLVYSYKSVVTKGSDTLIGCANIIL